MAIGLEQACYSLHCDSLSETSVKVSCCIRIPRPRPPLFNFRPSAACANMIIVTLVCALLNEFSSDF